MLSIDYVLLLVLCTSIYTDLRSQKIYNFVLLPAFVFALGYYSVTAGVNGVLFSLKGAGLGIMLFPRFYVSTSKSIIKALINMRSFEIQLSPIG